MDLSAFDAPHLNFSIFLNTLGLDWEEVQRAEIRKASLPASKLPVVYSSTLAYVKFPNLTPCAPGASPRREVEDVLRWLRDVKSVEEIVRLFVPDCMTDPHSDAVVERSLKLFYGDTSKAQETENANFKELNWRKLDMSTDILVRHAPGVERLFLYSSGNWAVIDHWFGPSGLILLTKVQEVLVMLHIADVRVAEQIDHHNC
jgi:hypothetical protein